jgi:hypothetical protein
LELIKESNFNISSYIKFTFHHENSNASMFFLVPYWQNWRGLLGYLQSVHVSVFLDYSLQCMKIFNWNLIYDYISMSYRPSLSFVTLDLLLTELFPLMFTFSFPDVFLPWMKWGIWNFLYGFLLNSYISSSSFGTFDFFLTELWPLINCAIQLSDS